MGPPGADGTVALVKAIRRFTVRTVLPAALAPLGELALNLRWSWHVDSQELFRSLDPAAWDEAERDPVRLLGALGPDRLAALAEDGDVVRRVQEAADDLHAYLTEDRWYQHLQREAGTPRRRRPPHDRLLLARVRHHRGAAAVLRRARHPGR